MSYPYPVSTYMWKEKFQEQMEYEILGSWWAPKTPWLFGFRLLVEVYFNRKVERKLRRYYKWKGFK